jgi:acyl dehydratase
MGLYYEDFAVGQTFETETLTVDRARIAAFAELTGDDNSLHTADGDGVIAHGLLVQALAIGLIARLGVMEGTTIALAQADCRFAAPVVPGDAIRARMRIAELRESRKPDRGVVTRQLEVLNQRDELTVESRLVSIMRRRGTPAG